MSLIKKILSLLGIGKDIQDHSLEERPIMRLEGTDGLIEADSIIGREGDTIALAIDFEFGDVPSWVQWDIDLKQVSIAQQGGAVAILKTRLGEKEAAEFESMNDLMFSSKVGGEHIIHRIPLILRTSNDNNDENMAEFGQELSV